MANVKVYSTRTCPWCRVAKQYLEEKGIAYADIDVGMDPGAAEEMINISGQYGVPVITVGDNVVVGFDRAKLDRYLGMSA